LERETRGIRPKTAPAILKKAFIAQLLKENEKPGDVAGNVVFQILFILYSFNKTVT
jgi:hypothetical protein